MVIAYLRISTGKQNLSNQEDEIRRFTEKKGFCVDWWVREVVSGKTNGKDRKLGSLLKKLHKGDTLIVTELSRLSRTLTEIMTIMGYCIEKNITLYSTKDGYAFDNSINSKVLGFAFGLVAEIERNLISARTKEALAMRKAQGVTLGRKKGSFTKLQNLLDNRHEIARQLEQGYSVTRICALYDVSWDTFNKFRHRSEDIGALMGDRRKTLSPDTSAGSL